MEQETVSLVRRFFGKKYVVIVIAAVALIAAFFAVYYFFPVVKNFTEVNINFGNVWEGKNGQSNTPAPAQEFVISDEKEAAYQNEKIKAEDSNNLPQAQSFSNFLYDQNNGKIIRISGACQDFYYTIVIFNSTDDYKVSPRKAWFNQAFQCPVNKRFSKDINLKDFNLSSGSYYFFVADQGKTGTWYNPR